ncbi:CGNR zinc finger domain-containing protein [Allobranchiibius sp. CTAmp26]|uniref:CGNR zinc finger domain-containing protein n=1 Tax=Allobranchiibius sp. CTAmp26 TaxID=2815214 RepID=UPI001AA19C13|nr:CGNR zinc finger domain-containing protein [Allobranchiibius sp. CTAmp26]MBO1753695.1 CGNR zinc finger domain-containing protein [Allobranchiibius sp. CTAmp26]
MPFTHDTEDALSAAVALVNSAASTGPAGRAGPEHDVLVDPEEFEEFVAQWDWTGARARDEAERRAVRALRPRLRALWEADGEDELVVLVNDLLSAGRALPQLVRHGEWDYHLHATSADAPFATRWMVEAAMAMVDVLRAGEIWRLKTCAADDCDDVVVDLSKNRSRRFCDAGCGNRTNVAAYRARQKSGDDGPPG